MIKVTPREEPPEFEETVAAPGRRWLKEHSDAPSSELPPLWRRCLPQLRSSYKGICAYFGTFVEPVTGASTTDHFVARSSARPLTYEWSNYRFACSRMNSRKGVADDVVDPFEVEDGSFELEWVLLAIRPAPSLPEAEARQVRETIARLELNSMECLEERGRYWRAYFVDHLVRFEFLIRNAPFIAMEAARQGVLRPEDAHYRPSDIRAWLDR